MDLVLVFEILFLSQLTGLRICQEILFLLWATLFRKQIYRPKHVIKMSAAENPLDHIRPTQMRFEQEVKWISLGDSQMSLTQIDSMMTLMIQALSQERREENIRLDLACLNSDYFSRQLSQVL